MEKPPKVVHSYRPKQGTLLGAALSLIAAVLYLISNPHTLKQIQSVPVPGTATVIRAVDGDTLDIVVDGQKDTIRLIGVDTPETHDPRKAVQCFGQTAAAHTKAQTEGRQVRLAADPEDSNRDKYKRLLRYVYLPDGTLLNEELIKDGYGFAYTIFPFTKLDQFRQDERAARLKNVGLWAGCQVNESSQIKQTQAQ